MIALRGVLLRYAAAERPALSCESLEIGAGLTLLLGPNGAGKSSLLKLAAGVERPQSGTVAIHGCDLWREEVAARATLAYVPEHPDLTPYATLREILMLVSALRGRPAADGEEALRTVGLDDIAHRSVRELSMGQRRRAILASAFVGDVQTVLLDEPLETMDLAMRDTLLGWVRRLVSGGATVVVATHELEPFAELAHRVVAVAGGTPTLIDPLPASAAERMALLEHCARDGLPR